MSRANLHAKHHRQIVSVVVTVALAIILFEVIPEKSVCSIPVKQSDEHIFAVQASGGFSLLRMQKEEYNAPTKEQDYKKQYHYRKRILIVDDEPDITIAFEKGLRDKGFEQIYTANDPLRRTSRLLRMIC